MNLRANPSFTLASAVAALCVVAAVGVLVVMPPVPPAEGGSFAGQAWFHAASGVALVLLAAWMRDRQEAVAYALLTGACMVPGWSLDAVWSSSVEAERPEFGIAALARLVAVAGPTATLAIFASTPRRRLAGWTPPCLAALVGTTAIAAVVDTWLRMTAEGGPFAVDYSAFPGSIVGVLVSPVPPFLAFLAGALGSVHQEARRYVPDSSPRRPPGMTRSMLAALGVAIAVGAVIGAGWVVSSRPVPDGSQWLMLPILMSLVGVIAARWSPYLMWTSLSISLMLSAAVVFSVALEREIEELIADESTPWVATPAWLLQVGVSLVLSVLAVGAASSALAAARSMVGRPPRTTPGPVTLTALAMAAAMWITAATLLRPGGLELPLLEGPFWMSTAIVLVLACLLFLAAAEAARARLVPAVAEAEAVARRPLHPFRYLETIASEALTARASHRRRAAAAERSRLASDLHAELLPSLAELTAQHQAGAAKEDVADRLRQLEREVRDLVAERRLVVLEELGIVEAIEWLLGRAEERAALDVSLSVDDRTTSNRPPRDVERAAFRIAQLAVENALQHASPTKLALEVLSRADEVRVSVYDDGLGFGNAAVDPSRDHLGISDMRSQAADVRGDVQVVAPPAGGTTVTFAWPAI